LFLLVISISKASPFLLKQKEIMKQYLLILLIGIGTLSVYAQGPPITSDKAIMLGEKTLIVKTLTEFLHTDHGTFSIAPLMVHYLPTSNSLLAIHIPYASSPTESGFGDVVIRGKYQIYRNDMKAKTHRIALKSVHWLPTGFNTGLENFGVGEYQTLFSIISGYETLKHGIGTEFGYRYVGGDYDDFWKFDLGFGLPLLKQTYPVNQLNLYFEYHSEIYNTEGANIFFAQGIQYARDQLTIDLAVQLPLRERASNIVDRHYKLLLGARYVW